MASDAVSSVAKENLGTTASILTAAALIIDYIMAVAVSISSATAAISSAFPLLHEHRVIFSLVCGFIRMFSYVRN